MYTKGDFHLHTIASDGGLSPCELVELAHKKGYDIISITDHDSIGSLEKGIACGKKLGVGVIPGIELSTIHNDETIHILGYFKGDKYKSEEFSNFLSEIKNYRIYRSKKIIENLKKYFNIEIDYHKVMEDAKGVIARPHIAKALIEEGYDYSWNYIFDNIISKTSPAYVPNKKISTERGIAILQNLNAVVVLAHPVLIKKNSVEDMLKLPFQGIEAIYPLNKKEDEKEFIDLGKKYNKLITAGSDFHGINNKDTNHGTLGNIKLQGEYLKNFLSALL